jgi:hypothetical protein
MTTGALAKIRATRPAHFLLAGLLSVLVLLTTSPASAAKVLEVGPDRQFKVPSAAAAAAKAGDTIDIWPGEYFDCAVWSARGLIIEGRGAGAVMTDKICEGKAIFVTRGDDITIRNLTFTRARAADENGAGIRVEGKNLTIENSHFVDNQNGILAGDSIESKILITDSEFVRNGFCGGLCSHGIYVGHVALIRVERSKFFETRDGHHIKSRALRTELVENDIRDGKDGTASYEVELPNGGSLIMEKNVLEKGPNNGNHGAAVMIGAEGVSQRTTEIKINGNRFTNDDDHETVFVKNLTATQAILEGNTLKGKVIPLSGDGVVR